MQNQTGADNQAGNGVLKGRELPPNERSLSLNATLSFSSTPGRTASTRMASAFSPHLDQALPLCPRLKPALCRLPPRRPGGRATAAKAAVSQQRRYFCVLAFGSLLTSSAVMLIWTVSPMRLNLPSGMATMWPPKPRILPTFTPMAVLPLGSIITACTEPRLVPSDDLAVRPTNWSAAAGAAAFFSLCGVEGVACGPVAGVLVSGFVAAGGLVGEGGGDCV